MAVDRHGWQGGIGGTGQPAMEDFTVAQRLRKRTFLGNVAVALYRSRRAPRRALSSFLAAHRDRRRSPLPPRSSRRVYRAVYVIPTGPHDWKGLREALDSIRHYEGDDAKTVIIDDATVDCRERVVRNEFPDVDVLRLRWPNTGPPRNFPAIARALRHAVERYDFEVLGKIDTDALLTAPEPSAMAAALFRERPRVGMIGTHLVRADGEPEDYSFDTWAIPHSIRWSPAMRKMVTRARANGYSGVRVNGIYFLSRDMLDAANRNGDLAWRPPWWTQLGEDFWVSMLTLANGFGFASIGGPDEQIVVAPNFLPLPKEQVLAEGKLIMHSSRRGLEGEDEDELLRFFRESRERDQSARDAS